MTQEQFDNLPFGDHKITIRNTPYSFGKNDDGYTIRFGIKVCELVFSIDGTLIGLRYEFNDTLEFFTHLSLSDIQLEHVPLRTKLPSAISTLEEAKIFLENLVDNDENYHPEDDAFDIAFGHCNPNDQQREMLNKLMGDIYDLPGNENRSFDLAFDPCAYIMDYQSRKKIYKTLCKELDAPVENTIPFDLYKETLRNI